MSTDDYRDVYFRAWPVQENPRPRKPGRRLPGRDQKIVRRALVLDTETTTDPSQRFTFGFARVVDLMWKVHDDGTAEYRHHRTIAELLIHADDLPDLDPSGYALLLEYAKSRPAELQIISRSEFAEEYLWRLAGKPVEFNTTVVGFNLAFDLSRMAYHAGDARGKRSRGGFTFRMFPQYRCGDSCDDNHKHVWKPADNRYRPRLIIRHLDSKKTIIQWGGTNDKKHSYNGQFLDLRQLIWGMTNQATSLASACDLFGVPPEYAKHRVERHGIITPEYIEYARQDVRATTELLAAVLTEYYRHPVSLQPTKVFSPASIAKTYLDAMGITPMLRREGFPKDPVQIGNITSTFYGGRSEIHIRRTPVPVTVTDFTSMYPTVNVLMRLWDVVTAQTISIEDEPADWLVGLLTRVASDGTGQLLDKTLWPELTGWAQIIPGGDILPVRADYGPASLNVSVTPFYSPDPCWFAIPDLVASALLSGRVPRILRVRRMRPGQASLPGLRPVRLGGAVCADPAAEDFFKLVVEQRQAIKRADPRTAGFLKTLANSGSYGIYVQLTRHDDETTGEVTVAGQRDHTWECVTHTEKPGDYCYPPIGSLITSAARLLLAITERLVTDAGGTWLFCDTDSLATVASRDGGQIAPGISALSFDQVQHIRDTMNALNPYEKNKVPALLKDETAETNKSQQVYGFAISSKRYCLFTYDADGRPLIPADEYDADGIFISRAKIDDKDAYMTHGLGQFLNPADPDSPQGKDWIRQVWQWILDRAHGYDPPLPRWASTPAVSRYTVSTPRLARVFDRLNEGKPYEERIKPFNFALLVSPDSFASAAALLGEFVDQLSDNHDGRFLAPYSTDPRQWAHLPWQDIYHPDDPARGISTRLEPGRIPVRPYSDAIGLGILRSYEMNPEHKAATPEGRACDHEYEGVLTRRPVRARAIAHMGKESNRLDDREYGAITGADEAVTWYEDRAARMQPLISGALASIAPYRVAVLVWQNGTRLSEHTVRKYLAGHRVRLTRGQLDGMILAAAGHVAPQLGIEPVTIGYGEHLTSPETVLAMSRAGPGKH